MQSHPTPRLRVLPWTTSLCYTTPRTPSLHRILTPKAPCGLHRPPPFTDIWSNILPWLLPPFTLSWGSRFPPSCSAFLDCIYTVTIHPHRLCLHSKYPFWRQTLQWPLTNASSSCPLNNLEAQISHKSRAECVSQKVTIVIIAQISGLLHTICCSKGTTNMGN